MYPGSWPASYTAEPAHPLGNSPSFELAVHPSWPRPPGGIGWWLCISESKEPLLCELWFVPLVLGLVCDRLGSSAVGLDDALMDGGLDGACLVITTCLVLVHPFKQRGRGLDVFTFISL